MLVGAAWAVFCAARSANAGGRTKYGPRREERGRKPPGGQRPKGGPGGGAPKGKRGHQGGGGAEGTWQHGTEEAHP